MKPVFEPVQPKHLKRLNAIVNHPEVGRFLTAAPPVSMRSTLAWYRHGTRAKNFWWAIVADSEIVGSVNLMRKGTSPRLKHVVEVGLAIDRPYWGMGFGERAIAFAKRQARQKGFKRFELFVVRDNLRAYRLYRRCGFTCEGIMKKFMRIGRTDRDAAMMSMWLG